MTPETHEEANASALREIQRVVARGESLQAEFKRTTGQRTDAARTICAMLNASGGFVIFGVTDDGQIRGQQVTAATLADVARELGRIDPQPLLSPEAVELENGHALILVRVPKGDGPYTYDGRPYLRVGPTTVLMGTDEYQRRLVERMHSATRWETQPAQGVTVADLDPDEIIRTAEEAMRRNRLEDPGSRRIEDLLLGFGLLRDGELLNAAVVLFCRAGRLMPLYPQCTLRMARFRGRDMAEFVDNQQETGNAFQLFVRAQRFLRDHLPVAGRIVPGLFERVDDPLYPLVALREALANAFCHRDYGVHGGSVGIAIFDDRLEISSTGPLRFGLRAADLTGPHPSQPWNPTIASVLYLRGMIEKWGRGTLKIGELAHRAGLVPPEFHERVGEVVVRFFAGAYVPPTRVSHELTELQRDLLRVLAELGPSASGTLQEKLSQTVSYQYLLKLLNQLLSLGLVEKTGVTRGATWRLTGTVALLPPAKASSPVATDQAVGGNEERIGENRRE
jgi:ATP-dependent DNA helicase RecG